MRILFDSSRTKELLEKFLSDCVRRFEDIDSLRVVGILTRGAVIAEKLVAMLEKKKGKIPLGKLDISFYRDDVHLKLPVVKPTQLPFSVEGVPVVLVDDVIYTGRTARAAMDAIMDFGRPSRIYLAVFVDRGGRELPICPDVVGLNLKVEKDAMVRVKLKEVDGSDLIVIEERGNDDGLG